MKDFKILIALAPAVVFAACASTPDVPPPTTTVEVPKLELSCYPTEMLEADVVPAEYKTVTTIVELEDEEQWRLDPETGEYRWIKVPNSREEIPQQVLVRDQYTLYRNESGEIVRNICEAGEEPVEIQPEPQPAEI